MAKKKNIDTLNELQYVIRKSWDDADSQIGITYNFLINAKKACDKLIGYSVFDTNGNLVYPEVEEEIEEEKIVMTLNNGDAVQLLPGAQYIDGNKIKDWVFNTKLYVRSIKDNEVTISNIKNGLTLGTVLIDFVVPYSEEPAAAINTMEAYPVIALKSTNIKNGAGINYRSICEAKKYDLFTITAEKDGWGKLQVGPGWINLNEVKKLV